MSGDENCRKQGDIFQPLSGSCGSENCEKNATHNKKSSYRNSHEKHCINFLLARYRECDCTQYSGHNPVKQGDSSLTPPQIQEACDAGVRDQPKPVICFFRYAGQGCIRHPSSEFPRTRSAVPTFPYERIPSIASKNPASVFPPYPGMIFCGKKFQGRNPANAPETINASIVTLICDGSSKCKAK